MKYTLTITLSLFLSFLSLAQLDTNVYWVQFSDKNNSNYSLNSPEDFLSERAIERRTRYNIALDSLDLPVNQWYLDSVSNKGARLLNASKWFNGVTVHISNPQLIDSINQLSFAKVEQPNFAPYPLPDDFTSLGTPFSIAHNNEDKNYSEPAKARTTHYNYGQADRQITQLKGKRLHENNYQGQGMLIAVLDGGFGPGPLTFIQKLYEEGKIEYAWDFIAQDTNVFNDHYHGKAVLSTMAVAQNLIFVGTAPLAHYLLFRTEQVGAEQLLEELNWISACELADKMGADLVNSSLGYKTFDITSNSYTWDDLNGQTAPMSIATNIAASRGMLMINSAGNDGASAWKKITVPSDAPGCLTVGACTPFNVKADFSSVGYSADNRVKPDVAALGFLSTAITETQPVFISGTSFSSPILCGMAACLWQVDRNRKNYEIMQLIRRHSHQVTSPDSLLGYGIPNFEAAYEEINTEIKAREKAENDLLEIYPTLFNDYFKLKVFTAQQQDLLIKIIDTKGQIVRATTIKCDSNSINNSFIQGLSSLNAGIYIVSLQFNDRIISRKLIKK